MKRRFAAGLVVGKLAPLHRGHELVIRTALGACDEVLVLAYSKPEIAGCEAPKRARWLAELFPEARAVVLTDAVVASLLAGAGPMPHNDAPADEHRRFCALICDRLGVRPEAVFTSEDYGPGFAAALTAFARERDPRAPVVEHVPVDPARARAPISGTRIRADVHAHREWLSPVVYASFVERVCLLGGESSGKSTLAAALAQRFGTRHATEYGRELWEARAGDLRFEDMTHIAERQVSREEELCRSANRYLFCDTSPLTTLFYGRALFGRVEPSLEGSARRAYALTVLCAPDFPFVQDGTRRDAAFRAAQHAYYVDELARRGVPYLLATGSVAERVAQVEAALRDEAARPRAVTDAGSP